MCVCVAGVLLTNASAHTGQRCEIPKSGVRGSCKSPDVAVEWIQVLRKSSVCSLALSHLSSLSKRFPECGKSKAGAIRLGEQDRDLARGACGKVNQNSQLLPSNSIISVALPHSRSLSLSLCGIGGDTCAFCHKRVCKTQPRWTIWNSSFKINIGSASKPTKWTGSHIEARQSSISQWWGGKGQGGGGDNKVRRTKTFGSRRGRRVGRKEVPNPQFPSPGRRPASTQSLWARRQFCRYARCSYFSVKVFPKPLIKR